MITGRYNTLGSLLISVHHDLSTDRCVRAAPFVVKERRAIASRISPRRCGQVMMRLCWPTNESRTYNTEFRLLSQIVLNSASLEAIDSSQQLSPDGSHGLDPSLTSRTSNGFGAVLIWSTVAILACSEAGRLMKGGRSAIRLLSRVMQLRTGSDA